jgi:hypothetical protein
VIHITDSVTQGVQFYTSGIVAGMFFKTFFFIKGDKWHDKKLGFRRGGHGIKKILLSYLRKFLVIIPLHLGTD